MLADLKGRRVLVTGASGGIGSAIARLFAEYGATLGLHYRSQQLHVQALRDEMRAGGVDAECFAADLVEPEACRCLVRLFIARFGGLDVLVNNAGAVIGADHFSALDQNSWDQTFALNVRAPFFLARQTMAAMTVGGGGKIINISSVAAKYGGSAHTIHYGAAKAALEAITVGLSRFGAPYQILVNTVRVGFIDTPFYGGLGRENLEERINLIPLKRAGRPADVARITAFLASEAGDFITGQTISVSGGD